MLALCLMPLETYYTQNYAGIIGLGLEVILDNDVAIHVSTGKHSYVCVHKRHY